MTTSSDVRWAYKYFIGREPENHTIVDYYMTSTQEGLELLKRALFTSDEAKHWSGVPSPHGEFCVWRPGRPRIMVIGNCIGPNLGRAMGAMLDASIYAIDILNFLEKQPIVLSYLDDADFIVAPILGPEFNAMAAGELKKRLGNKLAFYELVYFGGVHPDVTYLGQRGYRVLSPLGDYHSKAVVKSFLSGFSKEDCKKRFADELQNSSKHKRLFQDSKEEYFRRESAVDIKIGDWLFDMILQRPLLYTINHPTADVLIEIAKGVSLRFDLNFHDVEPNMIPNDLSRNVTWPVHEAVASAIGLNYHTSDVFWMDRYMMDLEEFIWRSFEIYSGHDPVNLQTAASLRGLHPINRSAPSI